jgi:hypothetical protein
VEALTPFADKTAAGKAGFDTTKAYAFKPFTPTLPEPLGNSTRSSAEAAGRRAPTRAAKLHQTHATASDRGGVGGGARST